MIVIPVYCLIAIFRISDSFYSLVYLNGDLIVSSKEELGALDGCCINPVDLNSFFDKDGKIYGYKGLKVIYILSDCNFPAIMHVTW